MEFNIDNQVMTRGENPQITCPDCGVVIDLDKLFNHLGPEMTYKMANKLLEIVNDDFTQAISESNIE